MDSTEYEWQVMFKGAMASAKSRSSIFLGVEGAEVITYCRSEKRSTKAGCSCSPIGLVYGVIV